MSTGTPFRFRYGAFGWERYDEFTQDWQPMDYHHAQMTARELARRFAGYPIVFEPEAGAEPFDYGDSPEEW